MAVSAQGIGAATSTAGGAVSDIASAIGAGATAAGDEAAAQGFGQAATIAQQNANEAAAAGKLQQVQTARGVYKTAGAGIAAAAGNNLKLQGSAASILANSMAQGAVASQLVGTQTQIEVNGYMQQMQSDLTEQTQAEDAAKAAKDAGIGSGIGAVLKIAGTVAEVAAMVA